MINEGISKIIKGFDLDYSTTKEVMLEIMEGRATNAQIAAYLTALRMKGESVYEISACAHVMRDKAIHITHHEDVLDIVGTGGDEIGTINISTISAIILSAAGVKVAKHGNRSVSSKCGAADVLEALGVNINLSVEKNQTIFNQIGLCFMFAPLYHTSMKYAAPVRKEIGIRTIFNILGPLSNPAMANMQLMGVYDEKLIIPLAKVLMNLGVKRGMVVRGNDGLDEASISTSTKICEFVDGKIRNYEIRPTDFGLKEYGIKGVIGGDAKENAQITLDLLSNKLVGAKKDIILLNAGLALYITGTTPDISEGIKLANELIISGKALSKLNELVTLSNMN